MIDRQLGTQGPRLSVVGLGAWAFGGRSRVDSWGRQSDEVSVATVHGAIDAGLNWVDTAPLYGLGHSEVVLGRALRGRRDQLWVATKCGMLWSAAKQGVRRSGSAASIRRECEQSLRRLRVEHLDLLQVHFPCDDVPVEETWAAMAALVGEGKVRYIGVSNFDIPLLHRCLAVRHVDALQIPYSLLHREAKNDLLPFCAANGIGVLGFGALSQGFLTGSYQHSRIDPSDFRHQRWMRAKLPTAQAIVERLRPLARERGATVGQLAIAWAIADPEVTSVIVGARNPEQVTDNLRAVPLATPELRQAVDEALASLDVSSV